MKTLLRLPAIASILILIAISCKKNNDETVQLGKNEAIIQKAKTWFESVNSGNIESGIPILGKTEPNWKTLKYYPEEKNYVVEVNLDKPSKAKKYIVLLENSTGELFDARQYVVIDRKNQTSEKNISPIHRIEEGVIIEYHMNNRWIKSKHVEKNSEIERKDIIVYKTTKKNSGEESNIVEQQGVCNEGGGQWLCIDWYWQVFENGVMVYEEFLYSDCSCYGGGAGGGGSTSSCENLTMTQVQTLMGAITDEIGYNVIQYYGQPLWNEETGRITKANNPTWQFYRANFFLGYYAEYSTNYSGLVYKNNANDFWKWDNISFSSLTKTSGSLPPCMGENFTQTQTSPLISTDKKTAKATISNFSITYTYTCFFGSEAGTRTVTGLEYTITAD